ncbi:MAG TPA: substrate-binding domain-containing protein, partial [Candidatus Angelobacter sp.]|nr:substrate-binding domain-containing protein [Candidatus Angelobacter sp.]
NQGVEDAYKATEELLKRKRPFTALMAYDDMTALGAMRALTKAGVKVPEQCSVIGFDDVATSALFVPSLTTVRQPMEAMGAAGVNVILDNINARAENREFAAVQKKLPSELVPRESTRAIAEGKAQTA